MAYLLDANVFIEAKNRYYGLDFCPAFWEWLTVNNTAKKIFSIEKVGDEIQGLGDELSNWATKRGSDFFLKPDTAILQALSSVSSSVSGQNYTPAAISTFLQAADYYLVAHALAHGHTIVTQEVASNSIYKIKIPNVCIGLGVKFMTTFEMLRHERARFVLGSH